MDQDEIVLTLFIVEELVRSLDKLKIKCLEPFIDNNLDLEENREIFSHYIFIKESFKTLDKLQILIKNNL